MIVPRPPRSSHCPVCAEPFAGPLCWCADCGTPHHRDCFAYTDKCAIYACSGLRYRLDGPAGRAEVWIERPAGDPQQGPQAYVFDFTSFREWLAQFGVVTGVVAALFAYVGPSRYHGSVPYDPLAMKVALVAAGLCVVARVALSDYRVLDARSQTIWLHRSFFRWKSRRAEARFAECRELVLEHGERFSDRLNNFGFHWTLELVLKSGKRLRLTDSEWGEVLDDKVPPRLSAGLWDVASRIGRILGVEPTVPQGVNMPRA